MFINKINLNHAKSSYLYLTKSLNSHAEKYLSPKNILTKPMNKEAAQYTDPNGNNMLHRLFRSEKSLKEMHEILENIEPHKRSILCKTVNDEGLTPINICPGARPNCSDDVKEEKAIVDILKESYARNTLPDIKSKLSVDDIIQQYYPLHNERLNYNLRIACELVNDARNYIHLSVTHPSINAFSQKTASDFSSKLQHIRSQYNAAINNYETHVSAISSIVKENGIGNCKEYSYIILDNLMQKYRGAIPMSVLCCLVNPGDHAFVVLDVNPLPNDDSYTLLPKHAVICDAWAGDVYPSHEITNRLADFRSFKFFEDKVCNVVTYNSRFHSIIGFDAVNQDGKLLAPNTAKLNTYKSKSG